MRRLFGVTTAGVIAIVAACGDDDPAPGARSFDPAKYSRACTTEADCLVVATITDCSSCCATAAVRRETAQADYEAVGKTCTPRTQCLKLCGKSVVACTNQLCTVSTQPEGDDDDAGP